MTHAVVALVGRPNVGKSTLFNRLIGQRLAIVKAFPGVTRDRNHGRARYRGFSFIVIDTGGFEPSAESTLLQKMRGQALMAIEEADLTILMVDVRDGLMLDDEEGFNQVIGVIESLFPEEMSFLDSIPFETRSKEYEDRYKYSDYQHKRIRDMKRSVELYKKSEETFVEETESLKQTAAGAGLTDND